MKYLKFLSLFVLCAFPLISGAQVATTAGSNLTAWNGDVGATNNNNWNSMMNSRTPGGAVNAKPTADFGNCNSLILRCAQPKCVGCSTMDVARPIVAGCVNSNKSCKKHGDDLIEAIAAQLVSSASVKKQEQELRAQQAAADQAAAQNSAQMQQMQQQMQQMQQQMQQQNAAQMQEMRAALAEQKQAAADAQQKLLEAQAAQAAAAQTAAVADDGLTQRQRDAVQNSVPEDVVAREKITGKILSEIEDAEASLKTLEDKMQDLFKYAGCDARGNNCSGPRRVSRFKEFAKDFFPVYDAVVDQVYDALQDALAVGADITDVIMMMNGGCNRWGKFLCRYSEDDYGTKKVKGSDDKEYDKKYLRTETYTRNNCVNERSVATGNLRGGQTCRIGTAVPPQDDIRCTQVEVLEDDSKVLREWYIESDEEDGLVRVGCATSALDSIKIFGSRGRRAATVLDLDVLERILYQDAPNRVVSKDNGNKYLRSSGRSWYRTETDTVKYCALTERGYQNLVAAMNTNRLPSQICVSYDKLGTTYDNNGAVVADGFGYGRHNGSKYYPVKLKDQCKAAGDKNDGTYLVVDECKNSGDSNYNNIKWNENTKLCEIVGSGCIYNNELGIVTNETHEKHVKCLHGGVDGTELGRWNKVNSKCDCFDDLVWDDTKGICQEKKEGGVKT